MWKIKTLLALASLIYSTLGLAHSFNVTKASMAIFNGQEYRLQVELDLIELLQIGAQIDGDELINQVRSMSLEEIHTARATALNQIKQQSFLIVNQDAIALNQIELTQSDMMYAYLQRPASTTEYRALLLIKGALPNKINQLQLQLPKFFGKVDLTISSPLKQLVNAGQPSVAYNLNVQQTSQLALNWSYIVQGFEHVLPLGIDHIFFVLLMFLSALTLRSLIIKVSLFTLAHSITLSLAALGWVQFSAAIIEPLIALSIIVLAIQVLIKGRNQTMQAWLIFIFGLLHGLGFALVFSEVAASGSQLVWSLLFFNLGVEIGQLTVVGLAALAFWKWRNLPQFTKGVLPSICIIIGTVGVYWFIERLV